jgi:hypothetical protein
MRHSRIVVLSPDLGLALHTPFCYIFAVSKIMRNPIHGEQIMNFIRTLLLTMLAALLVGCSSIKVDSYHDESADFSKYKTYAWMKGKLDKAIDPRMNTRFVSEHFQKAVENELNSMGYKKTAKPQFLLGYNIAVDSTVTLNTSMPYTSNYKYAPRYAYRPASRGMAMSSVDLTTYAQQYDVGTLVLDIVDAKGKKMLWRGTASTEVDKTDSFDAKIKLINKSVNKLLTSFPPEKKESK